ncbi:MAG TPA: hypothetical protein DCQ06_01575, partial [Myxococcales bacterium]|nr:hypothetical protein [Myxococcales bacterium]
MFQLSRICAPFGLVLAVVTLCSGCLQTSFRPDPSASNSDVGAEVPIADALTPTTDASVTTDTSGSSDATPSDMSSSDALDIGGDSLPFGAACLIDDQCVSQVCVPVSATERVCSQACSGSCPVGTRCSQAPFTGTPDLHFCLPLPGDLCKPCDDDLACAGGACLTDLGDQQPTCGLFCDAGAGGAALCPAGFVCQSFLKGELCVPEFNTCSCDATLLGKQWQCDIVSPVGTCGGVQTCTEAGWGLCSAQWPSQELCDGLDNNCNGQKDEGVTANIGGVELPLDATCGTGACAGGQVICISGGVAGCSTTFVATTKDLCGDQIDNDCDGETDELCPASDVDGDGTPDLKDCQPYLAEFYPGAPEACCLAVAATAIAVPVATDAKSQTCDRNCDGFAIPCHPNDKDGDGFTEPSDCDDKDPKQFPGGSEKCGDGIDQDCDGRIDEAFVPGTLNCGVGACATTIVAACVGGIVTDCVA